MTPTQENLTKIRERLMDAMSALDDAFTLMEESSEAHLDVDSSKSDLSRHAYALRDHVQVRTYTLLEKKAHQVFAHGPYIFLKLPTDPEFIRREGVDMMHCLSVDHENYCRRMQAGEIEVYSMTDTRDNLPKVDIEVALTRSSYGGPVDEPTVTQIRGPRNQLPPDDQHLESLMAFLYLYGTDWVLCGHGVVNFDRRTDGDVVLGRWTALKSHPKQL